MLPATTPLMLLLLLAMPGAAADLVSSAWTGVGAASVVVVGYGIVSYDANLIKNSIEMELSQAGLPCIDIHQSSQGMPRVTIVAHVHAA